MDVPGIRGLEGLSLEDIKDEIEVGGKFVQYIYCVSYIVVVSRRLSPIYFLFGDESGVRQGLQYTLLSLLTGWWGLRAIIWTFQAIYTNSTGGADVTSTVVAALEDDIRDQSLGQWIKREYGS